MTEVLDVLDTQEHVPDVHTASLFDGDPVAVVGDANSYASSSPALVGTDVFSNAALDEAPGFTKIEPMDVAEIRDGQAIVSYAATEAILANLRTLYEGKRYDLSIPAQAEDARQGSHKLMKLRTGLERLRKGHKAPAIDLGNKIDAEAERLRLAIVALEKPIDEQIEAEKKRLEALETERVRLAEERRLNFEADIMGIRAYAAHAKGLTAERILKGIAVVEDMSFGEEWAEFGSAAVQAQIDTLKTMRELLASAQAREQAEADAAAERRRLEEEAATQRAEAARLATEKAELEAKNADLQRRLAAMEAAENARVEAAAQAQRDVEAKAQAEAKAKADAEAAAAAQAQAEIDAQARRDQEIADAAAQAEADRTAADEAARAAETATTDAASPAGEVDELSDDAIAVMPSIADQVAPVAAPAFAMVDFVAHQGVEPTGARATLPPMAADAAEPTTDLSNERIAELNGAPVPFDTKILFTASPPAAPDAPPLALGAICERLGFTVTAAFVSSLGLTALESKGRAVLFAASDWPVLKDALISHIEGLQ